MGPGVPLCSVVYSSTQWVLFSKASRRRQINQSVHLSALLGAQLCARLRVGTQGSKRDQPLINSKSGVELLQSLTLP